MISDGTMIKISVITVFPELHEAFFSSSLIARAIEKGLVEYSFIRFSDLCGPKERIDEPTCGHGVGMILKPEVVERAVEKAEDQWGPGFKIFFSPQGKKITQQNMRKLAKKFFGDVERKDNQDKDPETSRYKHIILVCSRYEGVDTRVESFYADLVLSIGDYVLMGGDIPAQVFLEVLLRYLPGVIGKQESVEQDSFSGPLLDYPEYGLPVDWKGAVIPEVVRSGNHKELEIWRKNEAYRKTLKHRFDWFRSQPLTENDKKTALTIIPPHYVVLMHADVYVKAEGDKKIPGTTSIASVDIHDVARSCATYGIKKFFLVSPLEDQQTILKTFLSFWLSHSGRKYNESRFQALKNLIPAQTFTDVLAAIEEAEGQKPLVVVTSAKEYQHKQRIDFTSQRLVWASGRPIVFVFGTGQGLCDELVEQSDFILLPIKGLTDYNHLSVRAATGIILDRWLGLNEVLGE